MHLVLVEPQIPQNTGNIARSCVMTHSTLHLVEPLGFSISQKEIRRAGLDYWAHLQLQLHADYGALREAYPAKRFIFFSTRGTRLYTDMVYDPDDFLVFGCETRGLPVEMTEKESHLLRIPMVEQIPRSLNLSNSVAVVLYEALRQQGFPGMR
ncbi:MAG: tRNA (cytidine(34)-2'-O)-methyltransferase [Bacillota bacterium]